VLVPGGPKSCNGLMLKTILQSAVGLRSVEFRSKFDVRLILALRPRAICSVSGAFPCRELCPTSRARVGVATRSSFLLFADLAPKSLPAYSENDRL